MKILLTTTRENHLYNHRTTKLKTYPAISRPGWTIIDFIEKTTPSNHCSLHMTTTWVIGKRLSSRIVTRTQVCTKTAIMRSEVLRSASMRRRLWAGTAARTPHLSITRTNILHRVTRALEVSERITPSHIPHLECTPSCDWIQTNSGYILLNIQKNKINFTFKPLTRS